MTGQPEQAGGEPRRRSVPPKGAASPWGGGPAQPGPLLEPWPLAQHDAAHSSLGAYPAPTTPYVRWQFASSWQLSVAIVSLENIFITSGDGTLHAINPVNGVEKWSAPLSNGMVAWLPTPAPALSTRESTVYAVSATNLAAFDTASGEMLWNTFLTGDTLWDPQVAPDGTIVVTGQLGLWSVSSNGSVQWKNATLPTLGNEPTTPPTIGPSGEIYFGTVSPTAIVCLNSDGQLLWETITVNTDAGYYPLTLNSQAPTGPSLYAATGTGVTAFSAADGSASWNYAAIVSAALALDSRTNLIYVPGANGSLAALSLDGTVVWKAQLSADALCTPSVDSNSLVIVADITGMVFALDSTGRLLWSVGASVSGMVWNAVTSIGTLSTVYTSGLYTVTALCESLSVKRGHGRPIVKPPYYAEGLIGVTWYIMYLMSQGMSLTQAIKAIASGDAPPVVPPPGPVPEAYVIATTTLMNGAEAILLSLSAANSALRAQLVDRGTRMIENGLEQLGHLNQGEEA